MKTLLAAMLLVAAPLAGQAGERVVVFNGDSIFIDIDVTTDRLAEVFEALRASLDSATAALRDCDRCEGGSTSSSTTAKLGTGALTLVGLLIVKYLRDIARNGHAHDDPTQDEPDYGESGGGS